MHKSTPGIYTPLLYHETAYPLLGTFLI